MFSFYNQEATLGRFLRSRAFSLVVITAFVFATVFSLGVSTAKAVSVTQDGKTHVIYVHSDDEADILSKAGITEDQDYELVKTDDGYILTVGKRINVTVVYGEETTEISMFSDTVEAALLKAGIEKDDELEVTPSFSTLLTDNTTVTVDRVQYITSVITKETGYQTEYKDDPSAKKGTEKVTTAGKNGLSAFEYSVKMVNGVEVEKNLVNTQVISEPVTKVISRGTAVAASPSSSSSSSSPAKSAPVKTASSGVTTDASVNNRVYSGLTPSTPIELDANGRPVNYRQCITGVASAYSPVDGDWTASGLHSGVGYIAVNPAQIPLGTYLYIKTPDNSFVYGYALAADTGGFYSMGRTVDLFFASESEAYNWGLRNVEIYVL